MKGYDFFTNTYITGEGRKNYLKIDNLEDPLFTSFTFDIDYITSPLFYTIFAYDPNDISSISGKIEKALKNMHDKMKSNGYDILPLMSANMNGNNKLGFGLQQNVYTDLPLYGATEYIYMVDKRNGGSNQNDVRNISGESASQSFNLGDSVKDFVNDNDKQYLSAQIEAQAGQLKKCEEILKEGSTAQKQHVENEKEVQKCKEDIENLDKTKHNIQFEEGDPEYNLTLEEITKRRDSYKNIIDLNKKAHKNIVNEANKKLLELQNRGKKIYEENSVVKKIMSYKDIESNKTKYIEELKKESTNYSEDIKSYLNDFKKTYGDFVSFSGEPPFGGVNNQTSFLTCDGKKTKVAEFFKFRHSLMLSEEDMKYIISIDKFDLNVSYTNSTPDWVKKFNSHIAPFFENSGDYGGKTNGAEEMIRQIMSAKIDCSDKDIEKYLNESEEMKKYNEALKKCEDILNEHKTTKYGVDESGVINDESNPSPKSACGKLKSAEEKLKNDEYTQALNYKEFLCSLNPNLNLKQDSDSSDSSTKNEKESTGNESNPTVTTQVEKKENKPKKSYVPPQTLLDILGFINGMRKMTEEYPYVLQSITGLDTAYKKHYFIKDSYLGSGDDKITITCLESLDLRVSSMFNRYFNAVYDRQYRRERVPINLRRFNCSVYVHDVRNFVSKVRDGKDDNRILELKDMYYSVIEFRFYDCEIVPEETGNIFNNVSNEAPSDMIKTNFTFTYGNCVVNFVPST